MTASPTSRGAEAGESDLRQAVADYLWALDAPPEKDCWDTETGEEEPGAQKFSSDWAVHDWHEAKDNALARLRYAFAASPPAPVTGTEDAALLNMIEKHQLSVGPQCNGGWVVEGGDDEQEYDLARTRKGLRAALRMAASELEDRLPAPSSQPSDGCGDVDKQIDAAAEAILSRRGFSYYTDPMEGGQDAYDISLEAREEAAAALKAAASLVPASLAPDLGGGEKQGASFGPNHSSKTEPASGFGAARECSSRGWQPIESAPKDGTKVLLRFEPPFNDRNENGVVTGVHTDCGWWLSAIWAGSVPHKQPTHWAPLPALGTEARSAETGPGSVEDEGPACKATPDPLLARATATEAERDARVDADEFFEECLKHRLALNRAEAAEAERDDARRAGDDMFASLNRMGSAWLREKSRAEGAHVRLTATEATIREKEAEIERLAGEAHMLREVQEAVVARWRDAALLAVNGDVKRLQRLLMASQSHIVGSALTQPATPASSDEAT